jgi:3-mercaptopyruvate sulfurtransferase SseA
MNQLVSTKWLNDNLTKVKILDASWHLPNVKRDALEEYRLSHIANSVFFDIDKNSNQKLIFRTCFLQKKIGKLLYQI